LQINIPTNQGFVISPNKEKGAAL